MTDKHKIAVLEFLPASKLISMTMTFSQNGMIRSTLRKEDFLFLLQQKSSTEDCNAPLYETYKINDP